MCGIVGYVGHQDAAPLLPEGRGRLEYRGYDSAGLVIRKDGELRATKRQGKLERLRSALAERPLAGAGCGLGHTRWATHGAPSKRNAHPVLDSFKRLALIHNGIIENFLELKQGLSAEGWRFDTDTDTEVVANLISSRLEAGGSLLAAVRSAVQAIEGMYAIAVISTGSEHDEIVAARHGPPLLLGYGDGETYLASDAAALLEHTRDVTFLENGDIARLTSRGAVIWDRRGEAAERPRQRLLWDPVQIEKGGYKHFMLKEIHEQAQALQDTFSGRVDFERQEVDLSSLGPLAEPGVLAGIERIHLLACGTSWHAALVGKFFIEQLVRIPVEVDYGSEYRYRDPIVDHRVLALGISQSGETADTLSAMTAARDRGGRLATISNVVGSEATRIAEGVVYTHAGPEIGVASTKAFTSQLAALYLFALYLRQARGLVVDAEHLDPLAHLPQAVAEALAREAQITEIARNHFRAENFLYLGRGLDYPIALEGALKLKEISYIHAEGYPAGEMKHGPIALIDANLPVVALVTGAREVADKVTSNIHEVKARDGIVIALTDRDPGQLMGLADEIITVPHVSHYLQPIVDVVPLQLLAYQIGVKRGCDVDQPRNLAKSVTVE